jgi:hypothetical protein
MAVAERAAAALEGAWVAAGVAGALGVAARAAAVKAEV